MPMSSTSEKSSTSLFSAQTLVLAGMAWAVLALLYFLLFSVSPSGTDLPLWYVIGTYIFECGALLAAAILCLRNANSSQIVSGRNVWWGIGLGVTLYLLGNLLFGAWELVWGLDPDVSLGDVFYIASYFFLAWGMILAVISRRLNLEVWQWIVLAVIAVVGVAFAVWIAQPQDLDEAETPPAVEQVAPATTPKATTSPALAPKTPPASSTTAPAVAETAEEESEEVTAPTWVIQIDELLSPYAYAVNLFYIIGDVFLLIIATALLLAFWGGRFSNSWKMIAAATFFLYVADMWFKYAETRIPGEYQSGSLPEVCFVFMGVLFGIGAVLEYDTSTRSRRPGRKRG